MSKLYTMLFWDEGRQLCRLSFAADNMALAKDHAEHVCHAAPEGLWTLVSVYRQKQHVADGDLGRKVVLS